jgi:F-type H+-transporting ATPase subunit b
MLQVNSTLLLQMVNFIILIWVLDRLIFRSVLKVIKEREEQTVGTRTQADELALQAQLSKEKYESEISKFDAWGQEKYEELMDLGHLERDRIIEKARATSSDYARKVRGELDASVQTVRSGLRELSLSLSRELTEKMLGRSVTCKEDTST